MEKTEQEVSFKEIFVYFLKRWFIILTVVVVAAAGFLANSVLAERRKKDAYAGYAVFYDLRRFVEDSTVDWLWDNPSLSSLYNDTKRSAMVSMESPIIGAQFLADAEAQTELRKLYNISEGKKYDFRPHIAADFKTAYNSSDGTFSLAVSGIFDTEEKHGTVKRLIEIYMREAKIFSTEKNGLSEESIIILPPIEIIASQQAIRGMFSSVLIGALAGAVIGILIVAVIYFLDPRVKNKVQLSALGGVLAIERGNDVKRAGALKAASRFEDSSFLLIASIGLNELTERFAASLAGEFSALKFKTLLVNMSAVSENGTLKEYLGGKNIKETVKTEGAYDLLECSDDKDWAHLLSQKDRFKELNKIYDKIVIAYSDLLDGGAAPVAAAADKAVFIIDQQKTRFSDIAGFIKGTTDEDFAAGACIYNPL